MIYITGDTHRDLDIWKIQGFSFPEADGLTKDDYVIIAGDFGGIWYGDERDESFLLQYRNMPFTTLFVDGNHENFDRLNTYPVEEWNGGKIHKINPSVIHLMRGQIYNIDGRSFFTFGGALSIDKEIRTEGSSWWRQEEATYAEMDEALRNLEKEDYNIDYIITHAAPDSIKKKLLTGKEAFDSSTERFLDEILTRTNYKHWYCGHYHIDKTIPEKKFDVLYDRVMKIV